MLKRWLNDRWFWLARWMCRVFGMFLFHWRFYGLDNIPSKGPFLLVSNHQSFLDPIFCGAPPKRHLCFLARDTLFANWFFGPLIASVNAIPVKLGQGDLSAMKKVIAKLQEGRGVCLFPEGTRTSDGKILPFKSGLGLLCRRGNATIVPVMIDGAFECWPRTKKLFSPGGTIIVHYGRAVTAEQAKKMGDQKLAEHLTESLRQMQNKCRLDQGKKPYVY
ncbi:MAG: 1-acyl-sn-glycerol-3-phosphate acyltransferase [Sedimentisphaerales bacterium]|nr:1-acyl-sn-glycerol-3-phosphate acyltransferase [Sedimentisphaerales bacterium]